MSGPQTVEIRRFTTSRPALSATRDANSSALFLTTGIGRTAVIGNGASSRNGTSGTPRYTPIVLAMLIRDTSHSRAARSALSNPSVLLRR